MFGSKIYSFFFCQKRCQCIYEYINLYWHIHHCPSIYTWVFWQGRADLVSYFWHTLTSSLFCCLNAWKWFMLKLYTIITNERTTIYVWEIFFLLIRFFSIKSTNTNQLFRLYFNKSRLFNNNKTLWAKLWFCVCKRCCICKNLNFWISFCYKVRLGGAVGMLFIILSTWWALSFYLALKQIHGYSYRLLFGMSWRRHSFYFTNLFIILSFCSMLISMW